MGESVLICEGDQDTQDVVRNSDGVVIVSDAHIPDAENLDIDLDALELANAWNIGQSAEYQASVNDFLNTDVSFDTLLAPGGCNDGTNVPSAVGIAPLVPQNQAGLIGFPPLAAVSASLVFPFRRAFVGTIGVAVIKVDGPDGSDAAFTADEWSTALLSLGEGLGILTKLAPPQANLFFVKRIHRVKLTLEPAEVPFPVKPKDPTTAEFEPIEATWRNPALKLLGAAEGRIGFRDMVTKSKFLLNIDWGYVVVITKYRAAWPAYCSDGDVVLSFSMVRDEPSLGVGSLSTVFAHETGHTVGALDEYEDSQCSILERCGFTNSVNGNCKEKDNPFTVDAPCLMNHNSRSVCTFTSNHFGWGDQNNDGVLDPFDQSFVLLGP